MGELGLNKIFGALLAIFLVIMGLREVSATVFGGGGGHHGHEYESLNKWAEKNFAYRVEMAETGGSGEEEEEVYDLGLLLVGADISRGERSFKGKCATCHTVEEGGANGTGPNLYGIMGVSKQHVDGFGYSGALAAVGGDWTYEAMDDWLRAPSRYARGTSMAFAGLNRDDERANVLAYLASYSPNGPAAPAPLPADEAGEAELDGEAVDGAVLEEAAGDLATVDEAVIDAGADLVEEATETVEETVEDVVETVTEDVSPE